MTVPEHVVVSDYSSVCKAVVHTALQEHLDSLHVTFSLNLWLNLYWEANSWARLTPVSHTHILQPPSVHRDTLSIISRRVSERSPSPAHSLHLLLLPGSVETHQDQREGSARLRTGTLQHNNFCIFMHALHDSERVWMDYFEAVVTRRGTTGARTSLPSYLCSLVGQTRLEWSENRREVSWLALGVSGQTTLQSLSIITDVLGSHWLLVWHSQYYTLVQTWRIPVIKTVWAAKWKSKSHWFKTLRETFFSVYRFLLNKLNATCGVSIKCFMGIYTGTNMYCE